MKCSSVVKTSTRRDRSCLRLNGYHPWVQSWRGLSLARSLPSRLAEDEIMVDGKGALLHEEIHAADSVAKRILLVEDDRFLRRACEAKLRQLGFTVVTADNGEAGLTAARTWRPDLVLLDLKMPRMSGIDVLRALRADPDLRALPVFILSNSSREQDVAEVTSLGIADYWVKADMSLRELGDRVEDYLASNV